MLPQVGEFKYLGVSFTIGGQIEREIDGRTVAASALMRTLNQSVVAKRELSPLRKSWWKWLVKRLVLVSLLRGKPGYLDKW